MKKLSKLIMTLMTIFLLAGCGNLGNSSLSSHSQNGKKVTTTTQASKSGQYSTLLQNGHYQVSAISGLSADSNSSNNHNLQAFEAGLLAVSQKEFSPDKYYFQEGQMISAPLAQKWLNRKSNTNPLGLNPVDNGSKDADKRNPIYLQQLLEQDFYTQNNKEYNLAGMTIGLSLNAVDYYTKERYGATFETKISDSQRQQMGQEMANTIIQRLRKNKNLRDIPIVVGLYRQNINDSLVGGSFFSYGVSHKFGDKINDWKAIKEQSQVLPVVNNEPTINSNDANDFSNFKNHIENYFPNLSGVTAQVHYQDGSLSGIAITITTQFYGVAQIRSFTQFVQESANRYLPQQPALEIRIQTVQDMQALITKDYNSKQFTSHVLVSY